MNTGLKDHVLAYSNELLFSVKLMGFSMKYQINDLSKKIVIDDISLRSFGLKLPYMHLFFISMI